MIPFNYNSDIKDFNGLKTSITDYFAQQHPDITIVDIAQPVHREKGLCGLIRTDPLAIPRPCIVDGRTHSSNPNRTLNYLVCNGFVSIGCFRSPGQTRIAIPCASCESEIQVVNNFEYNICQPYLDLPLRLKGHTAYIIGSQMGTGKTTQIRNLVK